MIDLFTIRIGRGIGDVTFGATRDSIRQLLGEPDEILMSDTNEHDEVWVYEEAALALSFAAEEQLRLVACETFSDRALLDGTPLVGEERADVAATLEKADVGEVEWVDEQDGTGQLRVAGGALSLWIEEDLVESASWGVATDEDARAIWPEELV